MNTIEKTIELGKSLSSIRKSMETMKETMATLKMEKDAIQGELLALLGEVGLKSIKTDTHTFSVAKKANFVVVDEDTVIKEIKLRKMEKEFIQTKIDKIALNSYAKSLYKEGEIIDGLDREETEYISVRSA